MAVSAARRLVIGVVARGMSTDTQLTSAPASCWEACSSAAGSGLLPAGLLLWIPGLAGCLGDERFVAGGDGQAAPSCRRVLHQGNAAGLMGRPGGVDAEDAGVDQSQA